MLYSFFLNNNTNVIISNFAKEFDEHKSDRGEKTRLLKHFNPI